MSIHKKNAIIIFTRIPAPGKTKTRLMPCYTSLECAKLHAYFLQDIMSECEKVTADIYIYYDPDGKIEVLQKLLGKEQRYRKQVGDTLGVRMHQAIQEVLHMGYESCVLIGADIPTLQAQQLQQSFQQLESVDVVLGPTKDGGYYLIGAKKPIPEAFDQVTYGQGNVAELTKRKLENASYKVVFVDTLLDIDTPEDILEYSQLERDNQTARYLKRTEKVSVILPIYNEESTIRNIQVELEKLKDCEIIFVDGGSTDKTLSMIDEKYRVISSEKGRANQMNAGAKASHGNILFFLHCDSKLPEEPTREIRQVLTKYRWGCFGIAFDRYTVELLVCRLVSNHRIKDRKVVFGDQGIFIDRGLFFEIGMYPVLPIMEDYQLSLTLKEKKEKIGITKHRIMTSPRRFEGDFINRLRIMWKMNRLRAMYREGVNIDEIARSYRDIR